MDGFEHSSAPQNGNKRYLVDTTGAKSNVFQVVTNLPLRIKLVGAFLLIALIPLVLLAFLNNRNTQETLIEIANENLLKRAEETAFDLDNFVRTELSIIRTEAQLLPLTKYLSLPDDQRSGSVEETEVLGVLRTLSRRDPVNIASYTLLNDQGIHVVDTLLSDIGLDGSTRDDFQTPLETGLPYVSAVAFSEMTNEAFIRFSSPVRNNAGDIVGVLTVRYRAAIFQQFIANLNESAGPDSFAILLDENTLRLAHGTNPDLGFTTVVPLEESQISELQVERRLPNLPVGEFSTNIPEFAQGLNNADEQPVFNASLISVNESVVDVAAIARMETRPWFVVFAQPQNIHLAPINTQTRLVLILVSILVIVVIVISFGVTRLLTSPITRLTAVAAQVKEGDLAAQATVETNDEIGLLADTFNSMLEYIKQSLQELQGQGQRLEIVARLSGHLNILLNVDKLLPDVVNQIKDKFDYYHVHIYLIDPKNEQLVVAEGTGQAGIDMKAQGHSIALNAPTSLVARAAREGQTVKIDNVRETEDWLPNPLLPDTYSEMAVPIIFRDEIMGVLDVQSDKIAGLNENDVSLLQIVANQVAISIRNAKQFVEVETALAEANAAREKYLEQSWDRSRLAQYTMSRVDLHLDKAAEVVDEVAKPVEIQPTLSTPIKLQHVVIGHLQLEDSDPDRVWTESELGIVNGVVEQLAQIAENMRLFDKTHQRASREQLLREVTDRMRKATSLGDLIKVTAEELSDRFSAEYSLIELGTDVATPEAKK